MSDSSAADAGQRAALAGDASLDNEMKVGVENQLNQDSDNGKGQPADATEIPTGLDAIKSGGPQSTGDRNNREAYYSEEG